MNELHKKNPSATQRGTNTETHPKEDTPESFNSKRSKNGKEIASNPSIAVPANKYLDFFGESSPVIRTPITIPPIPNKRDDKMSSHIGKNSSTKEIFKISSKLRVTSIKNPTKEIKQISQTSRETNGMWYKILFH